MTVGAYTDCAHVVGLAVVSIPYYKHVDNDEILEILKECY